MDSYFASSFTVSLHLWDYSFNFSDMALRMRVFSVLLMAAVLSGCTPSDQDEEKEPHFVLGQSRVNAMDYQGAVEAFEESLEVNPHSAAAHYQLAMLYENQESDPAAAIYNYEQYLKFNPTAGNADIIRQHIASCKQQLAADVLPLPSAPQAQQQLEKLVEQNRQLQQQVDGLQDTLKQWNAWYANQSAAPKTNISFPSDVTMGNGTETPNSNPVQPTQSGQPVVTAVVPATPSHSPATSSAHGHTHVVEHGETAMAICRKYGIKLAELEKANPQTSLTHIRVGEVLTIP
jgi:tetratricopeptide (TPR) repeat protein